jgi:pyruvate/2-oxoglutarate/acetoin dehydrogenase E1 component
MTTTAVRQITYTQAVNEALREELARDPDVFIAGIDVGEHEGPFGISRGLMAEFGPERVVDTPISEAGIVGLAVGAAATGMRPVVEIMFIDFVGVAMDQILNQLAKMKYMFGGKARLPVVVRTACGAGIRVAAQHSQSLEAMLCHIPGLKVVMPATPYDAKGLLLSAIRDDNPIFVIEHKRLFRVTGEVPEEPYTVPIGVAEVKRPGGDVSIITWSQMVHESLAAAEELAGQGIEAEVVDLRTLSPLDRDTVLESVRKTHRAVVAHEAVKFGGFGGEVAALIAEEAIDYLDGPVVRIGAPFSPVPFSPVLEDAWIPGRRQIVEAAQSLVQSR